MTVPLVTAELVLDSAAAGHLAVALRALAARNRRDGRALPGVLIVLQGAAETVVETGAPLQLSISSDHEPSPTIDGRGLFQDGDREYLTRNDASRIAGVSTPTVDRWVRAGTLASTKVGGVRRIRRADLDRLLASNAHAA